MFEQYIISPLLQSINSKGDSNAFCINEEFFTYETFGVEISKIRSALSEIKIVDRSVGLVANDDIQTYAAIFALWFEGLAYVPLHPNQPIERNTDIVNLARVDLILNSKENSFQMQDIKQLAIGNLPFSSTLLNPKSVSDDVLAYILFTSGSTGKPKGVPIMRSNVAAFMKAFWETGIALDNTDRCLQCFDLTFDVSVQCFLAPLTKGACTFTIPHEAIKYSYVFGLLDDHKLTFGAMAPSMIRYLSPYFDEIDVPSMKSFIMTAEASPVDLIENWRNCLPNADLYNFYGPTEATIYCTYYKLPDTAKVKTYNGLLAIGIPMEGITAIIVNDQNEILYEGEKGDLCVSGAQLTRGYWEDVNKTKDAFFDKEYNGTMLRFYRTGDLCYRDSDNCIFYSGRLDFQVKVQGYRIEIGEIEYHARIFLEGTNAIVVASLDSKSNTELIMFVEGEEHNTEALVKYMKTKLPSYMIPAKIQFEKEFPLNVNDKVDRNQLKSKIS